MNKNYMLDLRFKSIRADTKVYVVGPGRRYRLYEAFTRNKSVGPELPGVKIDASNKIGEQTDLTAYLNLTDAIREWAKISDINNRGPAPSSDLNDYSRTDTERRHGNFKAYLRGYFEYALEGDIVIIPPSTYRQDVVIGEFLGPPADIHYMKVPEVYGDFELPVRQYRELSRVRRRYLPSRILDLVEKPGPFVLAPRSTWDQVFRLTYGTYATQENFVGRFNVNADDADIDDTIDLVAFIKFVAANQRNKGLPLNAASIIDIYKAALDPLGSDAPTVQASIHSPGYVATTAKTALPLVTLALFVVACDIGADAPDLASENRLRIGNSLAPDNDPCTADVIESVRQQIEMLGYGGVWADACEIAKRARKHGKLEVAPVLRANP